MSFDDAFKDGYFTWEGPAIGLLDLDAFFASVEQLDHPEWRGKAVIVGGSPEKRGVVSTASYEARKFGVHSAMPSAVAKKLCPQAIWTQGNYARYQSLSSKVMNIIAQETPFVEQVSIDEAFFDVSPGMYSNESPISICKRIQERVQELGISCSIGLASNKTIAKIASEKQKPKGLTVVLPGTERDFLNPLKLRDLSGIGPKTEEVLHDMGIFTLQDLAEADEDYLKLKLGVQGQKLMLRAQGKELSKVKALDATTPVKSVSSERTFESDLLDREEIELAIKHVCSLVGRRLRKKALKGKTLNLKLKFDATHVHSAQMQLPYPTDDERFFSPFALELLPKLWRENMPVRLVGVGLSHFDQESDVQLSFESSTPIQSNKDEALTRAADSVRARFGQDALSYGYDLKYKDKSSDTQPMGKSLLD